MAKPRKQTWSLNPADVSRSSSRATMNRRTGAAQSRAVNITTATVTLRHMPTGIEVSGDVPQGHYSRGELRQLQDDLAEQLFKQLETLVARHLRVPGR